MILRRPDSDALSRYHKQQSRILFSGAENSLKMHMKGTNQANNFEFTVYVNGFALGTYFFPAGSHW
jgi:hypothetical protein